MLTPRLTELDSGSSFADAAVAHESNEDVVRIAVHRSNKRFQENVRKEVAKTLLPGELLQNEMKELTRILFRAVKEP